VAVGGIHPDHIVTPGVYVQHVVQYGGAPKDIEQRTVRPRPAMAGQSPQQNGDQA
jgi:3-oxoacid CoA-transferase subunit A